MANNTNNTAVKWAAGIGIALAAREVIGKLREEDLRGQVVFITGGSRGLGLAMAEEFAANGCRLALCARNADELARAESILKGQGADVITIQADVTIRADVEKAVDAVAAHFGKLDILVNNAGVIAAGPVELMTEQDFRDQMDVMFWAHLYTFWAVLPQMRARGKGRIVNITSIGGKAAIPHLVPYSAAKFAAVGLSEGLRAEMAKFGIVVTTVAPGLMRTGSHLNAFMKGQHEKEFTAFSLSDNLPGSSISVRSAAKKIIKATKRGEAECIISLPAHLLTWFHGLFPGATANILSVAARALPGAEGGDAVSERGADIAERMGHPRVADPLGLGQAAAARYNQLPPPATGPS